ncbi:hypothetical protein BLOT_001851 [Blomia tropicalis]|nr:hypothetical protein BLOT_001851 [Blomia tropicalis]
MVFGNVGKRNNLRVKKRKMMISNTKPPEPNLLVDSFVIVNNLSSSDRMIKQCNSIEDHGIGEHDPSILGHDS